MVLSMKVRSIETGRNTIKHGKKKIKDEINLKAHLKNYLKVTKRREVVEYLAARSPIELQKL